VDSVNAEDTESFQELAEYLYKQGHRKIGYFDIEPEHPRAGKRIAAYFQAMNALGMEIDKKTMLSSLEFPGFEEKAKRALPMTGKQATAWMCGNDYAASRLINRFAEKGINVPKDISITGFGGVWLPDEKVKLCTMEIHSKNTGAEAARLLMERIKNTAAPGKHVFLDCKFIKGNSVSKI
jgi:DNA-binding LacI/PurR family transcriptional regulator